MKAYAPLQELFARHLEVYRRGLGGDSPRALYDSQSYFLSLGGKRLRPVLALIAADLFDADPGNALDCALAVELFHNFTLIHDDILDNAPLRRSKPTVHEKWNTHTALLAGDAMLIESLKCLSSYKPSMMKQLSNLLCSTAIKVCEGQQLDMDFEARSDVRTKEYIHMITGKTGVLIGCALQMGAVAAGAKKRAQNRVCEAGTKLGVAFQLTDDLLDAYADENSGFGKQRGGDILANKKTFLLLKARELCKPKQRSELDRLMALTDAPEKKLHGVLEIFDAVKVKNACEQEADKFTGACISALALVDAAPEKIADLKQLALDLLSRKI